ncbi:MAG: cupin domain-containing protein [Myxococcota bacterium]
MASMKQRVTVAAAQSLFLLLGGGCALTGVEAPERISDARALGVYAKQDDPSDPYRAKYAEFRARRAEDMARPNSPRALDRYPAFHRTSERAWDPLSTMLPFDWAELREAAADHASALEASVRIRLAFDHPDLKISQVMIGPGGILPAYADGAPGAFIVIGGMGEISVEGEAAQVAAGSTVKLSPYDVRRVRAEGSEPLRLLWIRWAPGGDQAYIDAGYYLTGANQHIQPEQAEMPYDHLFFGEAFETRPLPSAVRPVEVPAGSLLEGARSTLGASRILYPDVQRFGQESRIPWLSEETMRGGGFFFSRDLGSMGEVAEQMIKIARHKAIFRASRPDGRWDFNFSESVWGPRSTYVEHSHVIPEFYYMMNGPVIYGVDGEQYEVRAGDILFNNSYAPHLAQGVVDGMPFQSFSSTFAPNGDRSVFERPYFLMEALPEQPESARLPEDAAFH